MSYTIIHADSRKALGRYKPGTFDSIVVDPPYELTSIRERFGAEDAAPAKFGTDGAYQRASRGFMGKNWDGSGIAFDPGFWRLVWSALKPGGYLVAFGGTRTYHRIAVAIEDAGFEIRDSIHWVYGTGFPKSKDMAKSGAGDDWNGWGTGLKPAHEPIILARKPISESSVARNVLAHGTGAMNIDASRIPTTDRWNASGIQSAPGTSYRGSIDGGLNVSVSSTHENGRWPPNLILTHSPDCILRYSEPEGGDIVESICTPDCPVRLLDEQSGKLHSQDPKTRARPGRPPGMFGLQPVPGRWYGDEGGASRFFPVFDWELDMGDPELGNYPPFLYVAKASRAERDAGCESLPVKAGYELVHRKEGSAGVQNPRAGAGRTSGGRNTHPTVKPIKLMEWLIRLVTPPGGHVLDPLMGSGSTLCAAIRLGFDVTGIELDEEEPEYIPIARARTRYWAEQSGYTVADSSELVTPGGSAWRVQLAKREE